MDCVSTDKAKSKDFEQSVKEGARGGSSSYAVLIESPGCLGDPVRNSVDTPHWVG